MGKYNASRGFKLKQKKKKKWNKKLFSEEVKHNEFVSIKLRT